jgi:acyl-CoA synthetase (AMP-forming)/AMP-acid ligase II
MTIRGEALATITAAGQPFEIHTEAVLARTGHGQALPVFVNRERSLGDLLRASTRFGNAEYLVTEHSRLTFAGHYAVAAAFAAALRVDYGVRKGDRVAICAANSPEWIIAFWAATSLGAIAVGLNSMWAAPEIRYALNLTEPKVVIADEPRRLLLGAIGVPVISTRTVLSGEAGLPALAAAHAGVEAPEDEIDEDDPAVILFTSGTSGRPKGATHSHRNVIAASWYILLGDALASEMASALAKHSSPAADRRFLLMSPLFHIASLHNLAVPRLAAGDTAVIYEGKFEARRVLRLIEAERVTNWGAMPTMLSRVVDFEGLGDYDLTSLRALSVNSAPSSAALKNQVRATLPQAGQSLVTTYGMTESSTAATMATPAELLADPETVGRPVPNMEVSIRDSSGNENRDGIEGEIWLRGAQMMIGYWRDPAATAASAAPGGWFRTGDAGTMSGGMLQISGRRSDLILRGAENVYPAEVENVLAVHPLVAECAVLGVPHQDLGEDVAAIVVTVPGALVTENELTAFARERLGKYKVPSHWLITTEPLPRNATGKVIRPAAAALLQR